MELIPFLIFVVIAFNIFKGFSKTASKSSGSAKTMMRRMHEEIKKAEKLQGKTSHIDRYRQKSSTQQRSRESLQNQDKSPWGENGAISPGARVATNYLKKAKTARKASHKSPEQYGRRGRNVDQNRKRTHEWGQRGDNGLFSGRTAIIVLVVGGVLLFVLSNMPAG